MKTAIVAFLLVSAALLVYLNVGNTPADLPVGTQSAALLARQPLEVTSSKRRLVDASRSTNPNGSYPGSSQREFDLYVWRPRQKLSSLQPLLVYSHGFMSHGKGGTYLAEYLASQGYVVAAPTFPLSNYNAPGGAFAEDVVNQPADVSFIIDTLLKENQQQGSELYQRIDPERIVAAGLSLGGMTTTLAAYHPRYADLRIKAAVSIAGPSFMFAKRFFEHRRIPFMMIATPQDAIVPYDVNAQDIRDRVDKSLLLTMDGASHAGFSDTAKWLRWFDNPDSLGCAAIKDKVDERPSNGWFEKIGSVEEGVVPRDTAGLCTMDPLPRAINPLHQHRLTILAVSQFFECKLGNTEADRAAACKYLLEGLAAENTELSLLR